jgi:hypothetical protein
VVYVLIRKDYRNAAGGSQVPRSELLLEKAFDKRGEKYEKDNKDSLG